MCTVQKAFRDLSVVSSGNKSQTKSDIFEFNYYVIQANNALALQLTSKCMHIEIFKG